MALIKLTLSEMSNVKSQISSLAERTESNGTARSENCIKFGYGSESKTKY